MPEIKRCLYHDSSGAKCEQPALDSGLCFWHDPDQDKSGPDIKHKLEQFAHNGGMLRGLQLKRAQLEDIDLVKHGSKQGYDLSGTDLYRARLSGAHLFNVKLCNGSLMKADLRGANLNHADLRGTNLLGLKLEQAAFDHINIGEHLMQEKLAVAADKQGDHTSALDYYQQSEEIYRNLRKTAEHEGLFNISGCFLVKELTMRRKQLPRYCINRLLSKLVEVGCGYGEVPARVIVSSATIIAICALCYFFMGIHFSGEIVRFNLQHSVSQNLIALAECLYYSVVTFTTLGYGDFTPVGLSRLVAALEAFTGSFVIALFVVVFVKKMTR
ncbi:pentapeptide repeat-containing protein [Aliagarivorans taiwanensis]|uniref:pentapeptide repeat-containing protein n=1 Tax=Aliagarivorans taiwanensis TaxID=561966 RepID=UPI000426C5F0|nr:pentapeptide repeat-containing protein [Aliagarivorans taiwanensis]